MASLFSTDFETGTIGAALANGSSGWTTAMGTVKPTYIASSRGTIAMRAASGGTADFPSVVREFGALRSVAAIRCYLKMSTAVTFYALQLQTEAALRAILQINSNGSIRMRSNSASLGAAAVGTGAINSSTWTRVEWLVTATTQQCRLFTGANVEGSTADFDTGEIAWTPAGTFDRLAAGVVSTTASVTLDVDDFAVDDTTWVGPVASPDSANAGADQSVAAWDPVTLTGTGSAAGAWSQISGPAVTLGGSGATRTFQAVPSNTPGATIDRVFRYTVGTATDDVTITTASAGLFFASAGGLRAARQTFA